MPLDDADFEFGSPLYEGYVNPWSSRSGTPTSTVVSRLVQPVTEIIATEAAGSLGVRS